MTIQRYETFGGEILDKNPDGAAVLYADHLAAIQHYEARLAEAILLMKEAAPAIDTISFALSERFDRFLAVYAKEDKP